VDPVAHHDKDVQKLRMKTFDSGRLCFVSGVFDELEDAERAVAALERRGMPRDRVSVLMSEETRRRYATGNGNRLEIEKGTKAAEGLGTGGAVPGLGLIVAGPLAGALAGAGAGGAAGGLIGALVGAGIPEYEAKHYEKRLKEGAIVVGAEARTEEEADLLEKDLEALGAEDVKQH
jgi:hypothetical protein